MKKMIKSLLPILLASGLLMGCGGSNKGSSSKQQSSAQSQEQSSEQSSTQSQEISSTQSSELSSETSTEESSAMSSESSEIPESSETSKSEEISESSEELSSEIISESSEEPSSSEGPLPSINVTVNFYRDYNYTHYRVRYYRTTVKNGELITDVPATPEAPLPEFPVFIGWSTKEITDDYENDIWNFETDRVMLYNADTINFYGIWAAE